MLNGRRVINLIKGTPDFFSKAIKVVRYPQYSLFLIELIFFLGLILYSIILALPMFNLEVIMSIFNLGVITSKFNFEVIVLKFSLDVINSTSNLELIKSIFNLEVIKLILNIFNLYFLIKGLIGAVNKFNRQKDLNYGGIKEQLNDTDDQGKILKTSIPKSFSRFQIYFLELSIILLLYIVFQIGSKPINIIAIIFALVLFVGELLINTFAFSPSLLILFIIGLPIVVISIGKESTFLNWTFLTFVFATFIGSNYFDESLVKKSFSEELTKEVLIHRKISFFIGIIFLFIGILLSEFVMNSTIFYLLDHHIKSTIGPIPYLTFLVKGLIFFLVFSIYSQTEKIIKYLILIFYYRDMELVWPEKLVKVHLNKKNWRIIDKDISPSQLENLNRIGLDTFQVENVRNIYYVNQNCEIPKKIEGKPKTYGYSILGVIKLHTIFLVFFTIVILPAIPILLDLREKVDDGIYSIYCNPDKVDSSNIIEISDDTIIYNGKAEKFDTRKQSFSMGRIKKNDSDSITVKFYKNGEEVRYTKLNSSSIPFELKEKYSGYFNEPGWDKSIFSSGSSTLIFNKNENKITKIESQTKPFVVIPEDKLDGKAKDDFNKHKREYKSNYFIFTLNTKYDKNSSNIYVAILSDGGKEIKINRLDSSTKDDSYFDHFTGKAE